jgi:hypothetical protein
VRQATSNIFKYIGGCPFITQCQGIVESGAEHFVLTPICVVYLSCTYAVARDSSNPLMLKLVLQGLAADWPVPADRLDIQSKRGRHPSISDAASDQGLSRNLLRERDLLSRFLLAQSRW